MCNILILSHNCFSITRNNGKTLSSIFSSFNPASLSQLYFISDKDRDNQVCLNYYFVNERNFHGAINPKSYDVNIGKSSNNTNKFKELIGRIRYERNGKILYFLRDLLWKLNLWNNNKLRDWILCNNIDLIFFVAGDFCFSHRICELLAQKYHLPIVSYFTDDYIINYEPKGFFDKLYKKKLFKCFTKTIDNSVLCYTIGEKMSQEYSTFWGRAFDYIMNCVESSDATPLPDNKIVTFSYFGGLHLGRLESLIHLANIIHNLNLSYEYTIDIYTFSPIDDVQREELEGAGIRLFSGVVGSTLKNKMLSSNFLIHIESFEERFRELTNLSVSTKIPEYLFSNRPIIAFGPRDLASIQLLIDNQIGIFVDKDKYTNSNLKQILEQKEIQVTISNNGYNYARLYFDKIKNSTSLKENLFSIINSSNCDE